MRQIGYDLLGLLHPKTDAKGIAALIPDKCTIGVLDLTFGEDLKNLQTLLETGKVRRVRVHFINAVRARNKNALPYDYAWKCDKKKLDEKLRKKDPKILKKLAERVNEYAALAARYPGVEWLASPLLEHDQGEEAWKVAAEVILTYWDAKLVNNPHSGWKGRYKGSLMERHGANPGACNGSSLDGQSIYDVNAKQWRDRTRRQKYTLSWCQQCNGKKEGDLSKSDPRTRKHFLSTSDFKRFKDRTNK